MQDEEQGPQQGNVEEADEAEEQGHVDAVLVADALLHDDDVEAVDDGADEGHGVADGDLPLALVGEVAAVVVVVGARQVDHGDEDDARERGQHADQLAHREPLDLHHGAEDQRPHAARRRQDRHAPHARVLQARRREVVGEEPQHAELEAQPRRRLQVQPALIAVIFRGTVAGHPRPPCLR